MPVSPNIAWKLDMETTETAEISKTGEKSSQFSWLRRKKKNHGDLGMISRIQFLSFQWHIKVFFDPGDILEHVKYNV